MKFKIQKLCLLCVIQCALYVTVVDSQFSKGVIRNNVFTHYMHNVTGGSYDHLNGPNQNRASIGYFRNNSNTTKVSGKGEL